MLLHPHWTHFAAYYFLFSMRDAAKLWQSCPIPNFRPRVTLWNFLFPEILPAVVQRFHAHSNQCVYNPDGAQQSRNYPCHKCGNAFTRKNNLYNHLKFQCGQLPRFNCPYCSYRTKHSSNVRSHIRRIHPNESVYVLDVRSKQDHQPRWTMQILQAFLSFTKPSYKMYLEAIVISVNWIVVRWSVVSYQFHYSIFYSFFQLLPYTSMNQHLLLFFLSS